MICHVELKSTPWAIVYADSNDQTGIETVRRRRKDTESETDKERDTDKERGRNISNGN